MAGFEVFTAVVDEYFLLMFSQCEWQVSSEVFCTTYTLMLVKRQEKILIDDSQKKHKTNHHIVEDGRESPSQFIHQRICSFYSYRRHIVAWSKKLCSIMKNFKKNSTRIFRFFEWLLWKTIVCTKPVYWCLHYPPRQHRTILALHSLLTHSKYIF